MRALTVWQPWAWGLVRGVKTYENRTWKPPRSALGQMLAIHAGKRMEQGQIDAFREMYRQLPIARHVSDEYVRIGDLPLGAIVGVVRLVEVVERADDPFFVGPFGWRCTEALEIEPVLCRGAQGLWPIPANIMAAVAENYRRAKQNAALAEVAS